MKATGRRKPTAVFTDGPMLLLDVQPSVALTLAFSPDGGTLAAGTKDGSVWFWDEGYDRREFVAPGSAPEPTNGIDFHPDGQTVAVAGGAGWSVLRGRPDGQDVEVVATHDRPATAVRFLGPTLLAVGRGRRAKPEAGVLELWDIATDRRREPHFTAPEGVRAVTALPGQQRVAWAEWGRRVTVWEPTKPEPARFNLPYNCPSLSFHPDGHLLAAAVEYGVGVFDLTRPNERLLNAGRTARFHLKGHKGIVTQVAFSPDGRTLATASWDETVRLWDAAAGRELAVFQWGIGKVFSLAYSPDGLRLAAGGAGGAVAVWDMG